MLAFESNCSVSRGCELDCCDYFVDNELFSRYCMDFLNISLFKEQAGLEQSKPLGVDCVVLSLTSWLCEFRDINIEIWPITDT